MDMRSKIVECVDDAREQWTTDMLSAEESEYQNFRSLSEDIADNLLSRFLVAIPPEGTEPGVLDISPNGWGDGVSFWCHEGLPQ